MRNIEYNICKSIACHLRALYPKVPFHFDQSGLNLSKAQAGMNKAIQNGRGWPDLFIAVPMGIYNGLFIEVKFNSPFKKNGELKADEHLLIQFEQLENLNNIGYKAVFGVGIDHCMAIIHSYLKA